MALLLTEASVEQQGKTEVRVTTENIEVSWVCDLHQIFFVPGVKAIPAKYE
jgi:hypothetical protein